MKKYRIVLLDFNRRGNNKIVWTKYANGLKEARKAAPIRCHYSSAARCFTGWKENQQIIISAL